MNAAVKEDEADSPPLDGPGRQLRLVREEKGLDLERVAALLHLSTEKLTALEADDYQHLPGAVFVQGYLRNYARLLEVPVEPLLSAFHKLHHGRERPPELHISQVRHEVRSSHVLVRLMTWFIVVGLIALVVIWWRGYLQWPLAMTPGEVETPAMTTAPLDVEPGEDDASAPQREAEPLTELDVSGEATMALPAPAASPAVQEEADEPVAKPQAAASAPLSSQTEAP